ncbi:MAG TPA: putative beta-lysine N-acetyltransferase [Nannocystis exedens]|nr:putative beta-lysine N-acetyltransferase [Nannocystis exedens]
MTSSLVPDIKPVPTKPRAPLGVVELVLGDGQTVKAVGVVYGLEHRLVTEDFEAELFLDQYNQRLRVLNYRAEDVGPLVMALRRLADANGFDKIIVMASHEDWQGFLRFGYVLEAVLEYYHGGEDAFIVSKFRSQERLGSPNLMDETQMIERITADGAQAAPRKEIPKDYSIRLARREDIFSLLELYAEIFDSYPSPLKHASYLEHIFQKESLFAVCTHDGSVVAAASAELMPNKRAAELTDCATRKEARGKGLMSHLLLRLEEELCRRDYVCAYTMARARSYGMNSVFHNLGYEYTGRLINNCDIYGAYEDMNIWVKDLRSLTGEAGTVTDKA